MKYLSTFEVAEKWGISPRRVGILCNNDRIPGAQRAGSRWIIPADAEKPTDARIKSGKYIKQKADRQKERWYSIVQSAAEQCKRNHIPEVKDIILFSQLADYEADLKMCAYENAYGTSGYISDLYHGEKNILVVIGPEGGFSECEIEQLVQSDYSACTLGSRILRAETAAVYALSVLGELAERNK